MQTTFTLYGAHLGASSQLTTGKVPSANELNSWYEAMADAWGQTLDAQAVRLTELSGQVSSGADNPSTMTLLTAESMKMQFLANNASTATSSVGQALEALARK